jgi:hypothetical protein
LLHAHAGEVADTSSQYKSIFTLEILMLFDDRNYGQPAHPIRQAGVYEGLNSRILTSLFLSPFKLNCMQNTSLRREQYAFPVKSITLPIRNLLADL